MRPTPNQEPSQGDLAISYLSIRGYPHKLLVVDPANGREKGITCKTEAQLRRDIEEYDGKRNIYYHPNLIEGEELWRTKPEKKHIQFATCLMAEMDPPPGTDYRDPAAFQAVRQAMWDEIMSYPLRPSMIVDSGNGLCYWFLAELFEVNGEAAKIEEIEARNRLLRDHFRADKCHEIAHAYRVPYTMNLPDARKLAKGCVARRGSVIWYDPQAPRYTLEKFEKAPPVTKGKPQASAKIYNFPNKPGTEDRSLEVYKLVCSQLEKGIGTEQICDEMPAHLAERYKTADDMRADVERIAAKYRSERVFGGKPGDAQDKPADAQDKPGVAQDNSEKPVIRLTAGDQAQIADQVEAALIAAGEKIYGRISMLVRPILDTFLASNGRRTKAPRFAVITPTNLVDSMSKRIRFERYLKTEKDWVKADPPRDIAGIINEREGLWTFPVTSGLISTPTMRQDGTLLLEEGYDAATGLILLNTPKMPVIPETPSREDALAAAQTLWELLYEFPFVDKVAIAVAYSMLMTPVLRGGLATVPAHVAHVPQAGTGKSYLQDIASAILTGDLCPVMSAGRTEEETEKRLGAALIGGQSIIAIDNCNGTIGGDNLCQAIERAIVEIRILGESRIVRIPSSSTIFLNGNNIRVLEDMCRRVIICCLDAKSERPELRSFKRNPVAMVRADRGKYIAAILTIARAYVVAGRPGKLTPLASFEDWSDTVRSALVWLGADDPIVSQDLARENDPTRAQAHGLLHALATCHGTGTGKAITAKGIIDLATSFNPAIREAVEAIAPLDRIMAKSFGAWLARNNGKIFGNYRLAKISDDHHGHRWYVAT